ncbi:MAG: hypothetical protein FWG70_06260 [Oscillospiraceae bacterium]|nr:hypothetical protein [Oscillospiraceae bacterium]
MDKLKIYLDNCCYGRPFDNQNDIEIYRETKAKMFIQSLVRFNSVELVYSLMTIKELRDCPFEEIRNSVMEFIENHAKHYLDKAQYKIANALTIEIIETGVKLKDASHTACAIISGCDYLISTDKRLLKYKDSRIKMMNPIDFVKTWRGDYNV